MTTPTAPPTTLTARSPEDLLAAAAVVLGFWPSDSAVMLTFGCRHPFHARVDLPDRGDIVDVVDGPHRLAGACREVADTLVGPALQHGATRVVLLLYSDDPTLTRACWAALRTGFDDAGIEVIDAVRVGADRWYPLRAADRRRDEGVAYDVSAHPFLVQAILDGRVTHRSRDDLAATLTTDDDAAARVAALVADLDAGAPDGAVDELTEGTWVEALAVDGHPPGEADLARLVRGLRSTRVRDAAWSTITCETARAAIGFWTDVVRRTPDRLVPAPAALLAWAAWQHGNGALAWCAVDRCREVDVAYPLAGLLAEALERAVPPSVWDGFDWREGLGTT